ncbi:MAG TPA: hypothetical protein V6C85_05230 [Allocoleopsis sp.]
MTSSPVRSKYRLSRGKKDDLLKAPYRLGTRSQTCTSIYELYLLVEFTLAMFMAFVKKTVHYEQFYLFLKQETNLIPTKEWLGIQGLSKVPLV